MRGGPKPRLSASWEAAESQPTRLWPASPGAGIPGRLLGNGVRRFRSEYPDIELALCEMDVARQLTELTDGLVDVAVIRHVEPFNEASATVLARDELGIACLGDDPLAAQDTVNPHELGDGRPVLLPAGLAPTCRQAIVHHCRTLGFEPVERYGFTGPESFLEARGGLFDRTTAA